METRLNRFLGLLRGQNTVLEPDGSLLINSFRKGSQVLSSFVHRLKDQVPEKCLVKIAQQLSAKPDI